MLVSKAMADVDVGIDDGGTIEEEGEDEEEDIDNEDIVPATEGLLVVAAIWQL